MLFGVESQEICHHPPGLPSNKPSGVTTSQSAPPLSVTRVANDSPVFTSHNRALPSSPPETSSLPSELKATVLTHSEWPLRVAISRPVAVSQSLTVASAPPEASNFPSGLKAIARIFAVWPDSLRNSRPVAASHSLIE